jgi:hypothetical protein
VARVTRAGRPFENRDEKRRMTMSRNLMTVVCALCLAVPAGAIELTNVYELPLVQGYEGAGGATFATEVCLFNPYVSRNLTITLGAFDKGGNVDGAAAVYVAAGRTLCWDDVLRDVFGLTDNAMSLVAYTDAADNGGLEPDFGISARSSRITVHGTIFSREIACTEAYQVIFGDEAGAYLPGVQHYQLADGRGMRTKIGLSSLNPNGQMVTVGLLDHLGNWVGAEDRWLPGYGISQFFLSDALSVFGGTVAVVNADAVIPFIEVNDRRIGDGIHRRGIVDTSSTKAAAVRHGLRGKVEAVKAAGSRIAVVPETADRETPAAVAPAPDRPARLSDGGMQ